MSETFRNTTFLIAIRDSGFVCNELLGVYGGVNDSHDVDGHLQPNARVHGRRRELRRAAHRADAAVLRRLVRAVPPREPGGEPVLPPQRCRRSSCRRSAR